MSRFLLDVPAHWASVVARGFTAAVMAFLMLQAKEFFDAGRFDTPGTAADAALIAGGIFALNAILKVIAGRPRAQT